MKFFQSDFGTKFSQANVWRSIFLGVVMCLQMYFLPWDEHFQFSLGASKLGYLVERLPHPHPEENVNFSGWCFLTHEHVWLEITMWHCVIFHYDFTIQPIITKYQDSSIKNWNGYSFYRYLAKQLVLDHQQWMMSWRTCL